MEQAIKKAIEGGWTPKYIRTYYAHVTPQTGVQKYEEQGILLDPLFWQALGKAEGWEEVEMSDPHRPVNGKAEWQNNWHRFIDHLASGKSADSFFNDLIK